MGTQKGLFHNTDIGGTWTDMDLPVEGSGVYSNLLHPSDPATIFAGQEHTIIHRATDDGKIWQILPTVQSEGAITRCFPIRVLRTALDPTTPDEIYGSLEVAGLSAASMVGRLGLTAART